MKVSNTQQQAPTKSHTNSSRARKSEFPKVELPSTAAPHPRSGDRLLDVGGFSDITGMTLATIRYKKHAGDLPFLFRLGRRVVCWERDALEWIESVRLSQAADKVAS